MAITKDDGSTTSSDYETANSLNSFFSSVFTDEPLTNIPSLGDRSNGSHLDSISVTYDDVLNELNHLKTNKSCGPDNCHPRVLKMDSYYPCTYCLPNPYKMVYSLTAGKMQQSRPFTKKAR